MYEIFRRILRTLCTCVPPGESHKTQFFAANKPGNSFLTSSTHCSVSCILDYCVTRWISKAINQCIYQKCLEQKLLFFKMWINFSWSWKTSLLYIGPPSPHAVTKRALMKVKLQTVVPQHSRNQPPPSCTGFLVLQIFTVQQIWSKNKSHELRVNLSRRRIGHKKQRHVSSHEDIHVFAWVLYSQVFLVVNGRGLWTMVQKRPCHSLLEVTHSL